MIHCGWRSSVLAKKAALSASLCHDSIVLSLANASLDHCCIWGCTSQENS